MRLFTLLLTGEGNGLVGPAGEPFINSPNHYERLDVVSVADAGKRTGDLLFENERLRSRLTRLEQFIRSAPVSTGTCMCGQPMDGHPLTDHAPLDEWEHGIRNMLEDYL